MSHMVDELKRLGAKEAPPYCPIDHGVHPLAWPRLDVLSKKTGRRGHQWVFRGRLYWCVPEGQEEK